MSCSTLFCHVYPETGHPLVSPAITRPHVPALSPSACPAWSSREVFGSLCLRRQPAGSLPNDLLCACRLQLRCPLPSLWLCLCAESKTNAPAADPFCLPICCSAEASPHGTHRRSQKACVLPAQPSSPLSLQSGAVKSRFAQDRK